MRRTRLLSVVCLPALLAMALVVVAAAPAGAAPNKNDRATGLIVVGGAQPCLITDSVSWDRLPPIYEIDTSLNQNGVFFTGGASIISIPVLHEPALTSPQVIETFFFDPDVFTFNYSATFVLKDRHKNVVATTTSPDVAAACFP
jgi:hypothetical protein